ncbi:MAG: DNA repair protein RecO, partial [Ignavibacteria bacterium]|nr:DNA repair protein RecO [Ignavibacteria bacterium]
MTEILKDRGLVLTKKNFRETSRIVSIFSENHGKLNLIAKGVRSTKSRLSALIEPLTLIEFVYYRKSNRNLQYISSADFLDDFTHIKSDFEKLQVAFALI